MEKSDNKEVEVKEEEVNQIISHILQMHQKKEGEPEKKEAPELTDEFAKTLGDFKSAEDFKNKVRKNLKREKEMAKTRENREKITEELIKQTKLEIPETAVQGELQSVRRRLEHDLKHQNMTMDEYMKKMGMTEEEFFKEQGKYIKRQLKTKIILEKIAEEEGVKPDEKIVELQTQMLKQRYPDIEEGNLKSYVRMMLKNEKVLKTLESGDKKQ
jgi:trigger factor